MTGRRRVALLLLVVAAKLAGCASLQAPARPIPPYPGALCVVGGGPVVRVVRDMAGPAVVSPSGWWVVEPVAGGAWGIVAAGQLSGCV